MSTAVALTPRTTSRSDLYRAVQSAMEVDKQHRGRTIGAKTRMLHERLMKLVTGLSRTATELTLTEVEAETLKSLAKIVAVGSTQAPEDVSIVLGWVDAVCG